VRDIAVLVFELALASCIALATSATMIPFSVIALVFWGVVTIEFLRYRWRKNGLGNAALGVAASSMTFGTILLGAAMYLPSKTVEKQLARAVKLKSTEMSLAELEHYLRYDRKHVPIHVWLTFAEDDKDALVRFPSPQITLREFIECIESQTVLRHRFMHCGNGWTLLHGGDCCFGLGIRDLDLIGAPPRPKKVYDGDSYVPPSKKDAT